MNQNDGNEQVCVRVKQELFDRLKRTGWPKRDAFVSYYKEKGYRGSPWYGYRDMRRGDAVPHAIGFCLVEYLQKKRGWDDVTVENGLEVILTSHDGLWGSGWSGILNALTDNLRDRDEMYVHKPAQEIPHLAKTLITYVGRENTKIGEASDDESCFRRGEKTTKMSVHDFSRIFSIAHAKDYRSIAYAIAAVKNGEKVEYKRVSATVVIPLSSSAFQRLRSGELTDDRLQADDIESPSKYALLEAVVRFTKPGEVPDRVRDVAEASNIGYQTAYFTRVKSRPWRPVLCSIAGSPSHRQILLNQGFVETGALIRGPENRFMVLCHPREIGGGWSVKNWVSYKMVQLMLRLYQLANYQEWRDDDRLKKQ